MKYLHVVNNVTSGGIAAFVTSLCRMNSTSNTIHDVLLVGSVLPEPSDAEYRVHHVDLKGGRLLSTLTRLNTIVRSYDTVFLHSPHPLPALACLVCRTRHYVFQHGLTMASASPFRRVLKTLWYQVLVNLLADKVICSTRFASDKMRKRGIICLPARIRIIPFGITTPAPVSHDRPASARQDLHIGTAGRMVGQKRFDLILESLRGYAGNRRIIVHLAGDGPDLDRLRALAQSVESDKVHTQFHGWLSDMRNFYGLLDMFIFPSANESFGLVVAEALAHGVPVAVFDDVGGALDLIDDGRNGMVLRHPDDLGRLWAAAGSGSLVRDLQEGARQTRLDRYDVKETRRQLESLAR